MAETGVKSLFEYSAKLLNGDTMSLASLKGKFESVKILFVTKSDIISIPYFLKVWKFPKKTAWLKIICIQGHVPLSSKYQLLEIWIALVNEPIGSYQIQHLNCFNCRESVITSFLPLYLSNVIQCGNYFLYPFLFFLSLFRSFFFPYSLRKLTLQTYMSQILTNLQPKVNRFLR